ncbi:MAG: DUF488 family protein [Bacteriovorax sp.]|nr:DUF488 family protein [Bacteriovorax sp.]
MIKMKRAYEPAQKKDGYRVLIDRLWPRGIKKAKLIHDEWAKELAPSTELRQNFGHELSEWKKFRSLYKKELRHKEPSQKISLLVKLARHKTVTLVYSSRDEEHNDAVVLKEVLERMLNKIAG